MGKLAFIFLGGALGALMRYGVSTGTHRIGGDSFPWGTLAVNLIGSFLIGALWGLFERIEVSQQMRHLLVTGMLGAFTTFSTYSLENLHLLRDGNWRYALLNIAVSTVGGLLLVLLGALSTGGLNLPLK